MLQDGTALSSFPLCTGNLCFCQVFGITGPSSSGLDCCEQDVLKSGREKPFVILKVEMNELMPFKSSTLFFNDREGIIKKDNISNLTFPQLF